MLKQTLLTCLGLSALTAAPLLFAADAKIPTGPYQTDFAQMPTGKPAEELFILNGDFQVVEDGKEKFLRLPGTPLDSFGILFGSDQMTATEVSAKIRSTSSGMLFPEFGIGSNDSAGWKLWVMPGQNALALRKKEVDEMARVPFQWKSGGWTQLKLRVSQAGGKWSIQGKAWPADQKEPAEWTISTTDSVAPTAGRASLWGHAYAGTPIDFDDLSASAVK